MAERRIPAPLVLAAASAMLAVAAVVFFGLPEGDAAPEEVSTDANALRLDDSSPELVSQSFYDAWRRRRWNEALTISTGAARRAALEKKERDDAMPREERIVAERTWDALSRAPLSLLLDEVEMLEGDRYRLEGVAEYQLVGQPYRRRVTFHVAPEGDAYRVSEMELGEVLTDLPAIFRGADGP
ncbi:MAG: hypothetical protein VYE22_20575 [Myxococcota bacterium]|nr:hypothetical protein [Myxococcota bacterium]